jgi:Amt family ammonium transporter
VKNRLLIDDSLDVMAVHGVGGMTGTLLTAIFAASALGGAGLPEGRGIGGQLLIQALGVAATALWSGIVTILLLKIIERWIGFTVTKEVEIEGLDIRTHGEKAYEF